LGHKILSAFYRALIESRYFARTASPANIQRILQEVAAHAFTNYEANHPVGYPLAWESLKDGLVQLLGQVVVIDLGVLAQTGFIPVGLETEVSARLPADWPEPLKGLTIRGRMDRIDRSDNKLRVIDYKFKFGANPTTQDKNLIRGALRGARLQPPFYFLLAEHWAAAQAASAQPAIEADFYYIAPRWSDGPLVSAAFTGEGLAGRIGAATKQTIAYLAEGVRQGRFFIQRGDYCGHCEVAAICRKNHPPSLWRAENDPITKAHRELQVKDPNKL
jgi:ATP-dependent helicase/nuclease subunit B